MALSVGKLAPSAVVLACVGYCVWPSVFEMMSPPPPPKAAVKVPELAAALFTPGEVPVPTRNPWGGLDAAALAAANESVKLADTRSDAVVDAAVAKAPAGRVDPLAGLKLHATSILDDQRVAIINDQMCAAQETFTVENASYRVVRVLPYKVVLEHQGKILELTYSNAGSPATTTAQAGVQATPVSAGASHTGKPSVPESLSEKHPAVLQSLLKQAGLLGSQLRKQSASVTEALRQSSKAGD